MFRTEGLRFVEWVYIIVLSILRQALGTAQTPPNQVLLGIALFLTFFIMAPVLNEVYATALGPYLNEQISAQQALELAQVDTTRFEAAIEPAADGGAPLFRILIGDTTRKHLDDEEFEFEGLWGAKSICGLKIEKSPERHLVIATELWDVNPQIDNPHLIFPGDELYLTLENALPLSFLSVRPHRRT